MKSYSHFGESIGTFGQSQFFQEPSSVTQADEPAGACAAVVPFVAFDSDGREKPGNDDDEEDR